MNKKNNTIPFNYTFGSGQAENDNIDNFFETAIYQTAIDRTEPRCILVGRTGTGKSTILKKNYRYLP